MAVLLRKFFPAASVAVLALAAAACSPDYNWRQAGSVDSGAEILLPARPAELSRQVELGGHRVEMSMQGARVEEETYTVAWVALPDATPATRERILAAMAEGMLRNIEASAIERTERDVAILDHGGARVGLQPAIAIVARGERPAPGTGMRAIFVARGDRAWQAVAMGHPLDEEAARTFLESFAIRQR